MVGIARDKCGSCYGEGVVYSSVRGPADCPDCMGLGYLPSSTVLTERRLRDLEDAYDRSLELDADTAKQDVRWLVGEVRRAHHTLAQVFAAAQDADEGDDIAAKVRFLVNGVLGYYEVQPAKKRS